MKPYVPLECSTTDIIAKGIYQYISDNTQILESKLEGWQFLNTRDLLANVTPLKDFFYKHRLIVRDSAVVVLYRKLAMHIDPPPVTAKINFPVANTEGWTNYWYEIAATDLPTKVTQFGAECEDVDHLTDADFKLVAQVDGMTQPWVFNSRIPHQVLPANPVQLPRIIASFTFVNEPIGMLE